MAFVDQHQVPLAKFGGPAKNRLDARNDDSMLRVAAIQPSGETPTSKSGIATLIFSAFCAAAPSMRQHDTRPPYR